MFDSRTQDLIRATPPVDGFSSDALPDLLSHAYLLISSIRIRGADPAEVADSVERLRELATKLTVFASLADAGAERKSALFVAATSFQILAQLPNVDPVQELTLSAVPDSISAALLFLAAGYPADASEMARFIRRGSGITAAQSLSTAISSLASGNLDRVAARGPDPVQGSGDLFHDANDKLFSRLEEACRTFARFALGETDSNADTDDAIAIAQGVLKSSARSLPNVRSEDSNDLSAISAYPAANQLSLLLMSAFHGLAGSLVKDVPPPSGPSETDWRSFTRRRASEKPYLWSNHTDAIKEGLLSRGISGVITFPTGAGKSTVAQLKVAATVLAGERVIYLVPTLALVTQVEREIAKLLNGTGHTVESDLEDSQIFSAFFAPLVGDVLVMTPERCLLWLSVRPEEFANVGLVVFDECHLLHAESDLGRETRSLDAMLCLLGLLSASSGADVLLMSALICNADDLVEWLTRKFGKTTVACADAWKPTRQARGSLIFSKQELDPLRKMVGKANIRNEKAPKHMLVAQPIGLFSLEQVWDPRGTYKGIHITDEKLQLEGGMWPSGYPKLNMNSNHAASKLAVRAGNQGLKVIVFYHDTRAIPAALKRENRAAERVALDDREEELCQAAAEELGGEQFVFVPRGMAGGHFGALLPSERELVESCFRRSDGIQVLFSTSTLAQGMNLPADLVIITRTSGRTKSGDVREIQTHDLLNAAGRAGRAGMSAFGVVILLPDYIVEVDGTNLSGRVINKLIDNVLSQDDRCLTLVDPIEVLLDRLNVQPDLSDSLVDSLLIRLPLSTNSDGEENVSTAFSKTLAAYSSEKRNLDDKFRISVEVATRRRDQLLEGVGSLEMAAACRVTGLRPRMIEELFGNLEGVLSPERLDPKGWYLAVSEWVGAFPEVRDRLRIVEMTGSSSELAAVEAWLSGEPLSQIQVALVSGKPMGYLKEARDFARYRMREVSYLVGLVGHLVLLSELPDKGLVSESAFRAAALLREGFDSVEKLILYEGRRSDRSWTRVRTHRESPAMLQFVETAQDPFRETPSEARKRVLKGLAIYKQQF